MKRNSVFGAQIVILLLLIFLTISSVVFTTSVYAGSENGKTTIARGYNLTLLKKSNITLNGEEIIHNKTPVLIVQDPQGNTSSEVNDWIIVGLFEMTVIDSGSKEMLAIDVCDPYPEVDILRVGKRYFLPPQNITKYYNAFTPEIKALAANATEFLNDKGIDGLVSLFDPLTLPVFVLKNNTDSLPLFITPKDNYNERVKNQDQEYHHYFEELAAQDKIRLIKNKLSQSRFVNRYSFLVDSSSWEVAFEYEDQDFKLSVNYVSYEVLGEQLVFRLYGNVSLELLNKHTNDTLSIKQSMDFRTWALLPAGGENSDPSAPILLFSEILVLLIPATVFYFHKKSKKSKKREK